MSVEIFEIARCPEHGLHGDRRWCFVCGGPVERAEFAPKADYDRLRAAIEDYLLWRPGERGHAAAHRNLAEAVQ